MTRSRETILARVWQNPPTSKRYVMRLLGEALNNYSIWQDTMTVYDQVEERFIPDDELGSIDPDAKMVLR